MEHLETARTLDAHRVTIADRTAEALMHEPFWLERFGDGIRERLTIDIDHNVATLAKAVRYRSPMIFDDHMVWRRNQVVGLGCSTGHVRATLAHTWTSVAALLAEWQQPAVSDALQSALSALAYENVALKPLVAAHVLLAEELVAASFDGSWHWQEAYRDGGRPAMLYDAWFLIDYLIDGLAASKNEMLTKHVRWLRSKLQRRGLSTTHIQHLLWLLAEAIGQHVASNVATLARQALERCAGSLAYPDEAYQALMAAQAQIVADTVAHLGRQGVSLQPEHAVAEVGWYLAYLSDSVAVRAPDHLIGYTRWMQGWLADQRLPDMPIRQSYAAISTSLDQHLPQYAAAEARAIVQAAQRVL